jgi:hypothetical protein
MSMDFGYFGHFLHLHLDNSEGVHGFGSVVALASASKLSSYLSR